MYGSNGGKVDLNMYNAAVKGIIIGIVGGLLVANIGNIKALISNASEATEVLADIDDMENIRLDVVYQGAEQLSESEEDMLSIMVKQAVLYGLAEKYGEDYNSDMTLNEARHAFVLSLPDIEGWAKEAAEEFGVETSAEAFFTVKHMDEEELNGVIYAAGDYETLEIRLY